MVKHDTAAAFRPSPARVGRSRFGRSRFGPSRVGLYLLLIHRGVGSGVALLTLLAVSAIVMVAAGRGRAAARV